MTAKGLKKGVDEALQGKAGVARNVIKEDLKGKKKPINEKTRQNRRPTHKDA